MKWIKAEDQEPKWPCLTVDSFGNVHLVYSLLTLENKGREFYLDGALYSRFVDEIEGKEELKVCIYENRIRYWMPLPEIPNEIADENGLVKRL